MDNKYIITILILVFIFAGGIFLGKEVVAGGQSEPGTEGDPLVAESYLNQELESKTSELKERVNELEELVEELKAKVDYLEEQTD